MRNRARSDSGGGLSQYFLQCSNTCDPVTFQRHHMQVTAPVSSRQGARCYEWTQHFDLVRELIKP